MKLSSHQKHALNILLEKFGSKTFTFYECIGLAIRRPEFTLETLLKKGVVTRRMNPDRHSIMSFDFWLYQIADQSSEEGTQER